MNATAVSYLIKNEYDHQAAYNDYIKDCLMSGESLEFGIKDFIKKEKSTIKKSVLVRGKLEQLIISEMKQNQKECAGIENGMLRLSLLQNKIMQMMNEAKNQEESKEIYSTYKSIIYNNPV